MFLAVPAAVSGVCSSPLPSLLSFLFLFFNLTSRDAVAAGVAVAAASLPRLACRACSFVLTRHLSGVRPRLPLGTSAPSPTAAAAEGVEKDSGDAGGDCGGDEPGETGVGGLDDSCSITAREGEGEGEGEAKDAPVERAAVLPRSTAALSAVFSDELVDATV